MYIYTYIYMYTYTYIHKYTYAYTHCIYIYAHRAQVDPADRVAEAGDLLARHFERAREDHLEAKIAALPQAAVVQLRKNGECGSRVIYIYIMYIYI